MAEFKGSILELNNKKVIVMTDKCDFITIKRTPDMYLGQQLTFSEAKSSMRTGGYIRNNITFAAGILVLALLSVLYLQVFNSGNAFAYIDLDINPSMEFAVDDASRVLSVKALNSEAVPLLKELELKDMPVKAAIAKVLDSSTTSGYISPGKINEVLISAALESAKNSSASDKEKTLSVILSDIESLSIKVGTEDLHPKVLKVAPQVRKEAAENNISMGRYELYKEITKTDKDITIEKAKTEHISKMLDKAVPKNTEKKDNAKNVNNSNNNKKQYGKTSMEYTKVSKAHNPNGKNKVYQSYKHETGPENSKDKDNVKDKTSKNKDKAGDKDAISRTKPDQHGSQGHSRKSVKPGAKHSGKPDRQGNGNVVKSGSAKKVNTVQKDNSNKTTSKNYK